MASIELEIKEFIRSEGVEVVGLAGPERLQGPPSLNPTYCLKGAQSIVSLALPMNVEAIYDFLGKKSPAPHNFDQFINYQRIQLISRKLVEYLRAKGYRAEQGSPSADYRRFPYVFALHPSFSHRFGAIASGIAGLGWSGNVMTKEYGASIYLNTVFTDARLKSDPAMAPRYFLDNFCAHCKRCAAVCPSRMFSAKTEERILLNNELVPRGRRRNIDLCHISCFGLHSLDYHRKWTNWGLHWIDEWVAEAPDTTNWKGILWSLLKRGLTTGDATERFDVLRLLTAHLQPEHLFKDFPELKDFPKTEPERYRMLSNYIHKVGIKRIDSYPVPMVCGQCALVCGPNLKETKKRYKTLIHSGLVVPGPDGKMTRVDSFAEAQNLRRRYTLPVKRMDMIRDGLATFILWHKHYFGFEPSSILQGLIYSRRLKQALKRNKP